MKTQIVNSEPPKRRIPEVGEAFLSNGDVFMRMHDEHGRLACSNPDGTGKFYAICLDNGRVYHWQTSNHFTLLKPAGDALQFVEA